MGTDRRATYRQWYGRETPPTELRVLRAGPLEIALDGPDLRYARLGDIEVVRRVYVAVRDINWDTIVGSEERVEVTEEVDSFSVDCWFRHRRGIVDYEWHGRFEGSSDGTIVYEMNGHCRGVFDYAKIGICVHHPSRESAGRPYRATTPAGVVEGSLPSTIGPQVHLDAEGYDEPLFEPCTSLSVDLETGVTVELEFEGSLFEMEDQRNWTDASFKSVSTPAHLGYRHHAVEGKQIRQRLTFRVEGTPAGTTRTRRAARGDVLTVGRATGNVLPPIGFGLPSDGVPHSDNELERVRELRPDHLRADVRLGDAGALEAALEACRTAGASLELALFVPPGSEAQLDPLGASLRGAGVAVARVLIFGEGQTATTATLAREAAARLPGLTLGAGTNVNFCDINRERPDLGSVDLVAYSINAQVHAFDERSLTETLEGQTDTVVSARAVFPHNTVAVTPVTLRPRFNPDAIAGEEPERSADELPWEVDPRQMSSFCAAWTLGSVKALAEAGAGSLTYYETVGWRGLFERDGGSAMPDLFLSTPGMVFPVFHIFAALREWAGADVIECRTSDPLALSGLVLRRDGATGLMVANLTYEARRVSVEPLDLEVELGPFAVETVALGG